MKNRQGFEMVLGQVSSPYSKTVIAMAWRNCIGGRDMDLINLILCDVAAMGNASE